MVVAVRQLAELPVEALAAGVVLARVAPAVAAPVAERLDQRLERRAVRSARAAFAHGDVVRRIEADAWPGRRRCRPAGRRTVAPTASQQSSISQRSCSLGERGDRVEVERIAQRVRDMTARVAVATRRLELRRRRCCRSAASTSTKTGTSPFWMIGLTVVGKPAATVITSSPGLQPPVARAWARSGTESASRLADEPELTSSAWRSPKNSAKSLLELRRRSGRW